MLLLPLSKDSSVSSRLFDEASFQKVLEIHVHYIEVYWDAWWFPDSCSSKILGYVIKTVCSTEELWETTAGGGAQIIPYWTDPRPIKESIGPSKAHVHKPRGAQRRQDPNYRPPRSEHLVWAPLRAVLAETSSSWSRHITHKDKLPGTALQITFQTNCCLGVWHIMGCRRRAVLDYAGFITGCLREKPKVGKMNGLGEEIWGGTSVRK